MNRSLIAVALTTGLIGLAPPTGHAADLAFATSEGLFRLEPNGGDRQALLPSRDRPFNALVWSSDGQQLAVVQNYTEVYRVNPAAENVELIFSSNCQTSPSLTVAWQTDSPTLVIQERCPSPRAGTPAQLALYLSDATGKLTIPLTLPASLESDVYLSPQGSRVAYAAGQHIFIAALDGSRPQRITQTPGTYGAAGSPLAWSPDGTRLAFYEGSYPFQRLNVVTTTGDDRRVLTPEPNFQIYRSRVLWSPDGRYIAFYQPYNPPFSNQEVVALVNVNTGETQMVTRPGFYDALSWAPNSQALAMASGLQAGQQALFKFNLVNQEFTPLTNQPLQNILESQWSPAGDWVAFTATPDGDSFGTQVLHRVRPDGSQLAAITDVDEYVYPFTWVPEPATAQTSGAE